MWPPAAASGAYYGKQWNSETRSWRYYSLVEDAKEYEEAEVEFQKQTEEKKKRAKAKKEYEDGEGAVLAEA